MVSQMKTAEEIIEILKQQGFDTEQGLQICIGDSDIYMEVLETALEEGRDKIPLIRDSVENGDYERYLIEVHGLKNAAKSIGAMTLSQMSYEQEMAARQGDYDCVNQNYKALLEKYEEILNQMDEALR